MAVAACQRIGAETSDQDVVAPCAIEPVGFVIAGQGIVAAAAAYPLDVGQGVVAITDDIGLPGQQIRNQGSHHTFLIVGDIRSSSAVKSVVATIPVKDVIAVPA